MKKIFLIVCLLSAALASCSVTAQQTTSQNLVDQSAAEATAIIQRAQSTAMVLQAQAQATAILSSAGLPASISTPETPPRLSQAITPSVTSPTTGGANQNDLETVKLLGVGFGADGVYINVQFTAQPAVTRTWGQGNVSVTDEATGVVYDNIPVMPILGPLLGRPRYMGQIGYVMFVNTPPGLKPGAMVTVVLGNFKQEHVPIHQ